MQSLNLSFWGASKLPVVLQTESAECGLACLCMIANYWGYRSDLPTLRRRFSVSVKGVTLLTLMSMAQGLSLKTRPLKLDIHHLPDLKLPCILHWGLNHFVVLKSVSASGILIHDPAIGEMRISMEDTSKYFTGIALELTPAPQFQKKQEIQQFSISDLTGPLTGLKRGVVKLFALGISLQICAMLMPFFAQWLVDEALLSGDYDLISVLGCGFLLLAIVQASVNAIRSWVTTTLSTNLKFQWFGNAFMHLLRLPLPYFEKRHTGDIVSRFGSIQAIQHALTTQVVEGLIDGVLVTGTLVIMLLYSVQLTSVAILAVAMYIGLRAALFSSLRSATAESIIHAAKQQSYFMESIRGIQSVRLFNRSSVRYSGWMNILADQFNSDLRVAKLSISYQTVSSMLINVERVVVLWLAGLLVLKDPRFTIGMLYAFISFKDQFSQRVSSLVDKFFEIRMLKLHGDRVADIVLAEAEEIHDMADIDMDKCELTIELRNLSYRYSEAEPFVFKDLNLTIPAGQFIAFTGPSGCGKTTLLKILLGLLKPTAGEVLIGGIELSRLGVNNYSKVLGVVMQDDSLFAGSIADNISFLDPNPDSEKIKASAFMAAIHEEIMAMPMAYNTLIGDIGSGLSGGQKQRLLLARALYKRPRLLVLDEATSHLDSANEQFVNTSIRNLALTRIVVAHRPETIAMAERVVVLNEVLTLP